MLLQLQILLQHGVGELLLGVRLLLLLWEGLQLLQRLLLLWEGLLLLQWLLLLWEGLLLRQWLLLVRIW